MADERLERNWKMANAASDNVMRPPNDQYRDNYDAIVWESKKRSDQKADEEAPCQ